MCDIAQAPSLLSSAHFLQSVLFEQCNMKAPRGKQKINKEVPVNGSAQA